MPSRLKTGYYARILVIVSNLQLLILSDKSITEVSLVTPPPHEPGLLPAWLAEKGVTDVIAGGMGQRAIDLFNHQKINVFVGAQIKSHSELATICLMIHLLPEQIIATINSRIYDFRLSMFLLLYQGI